MRKDTMKHPWRKSRIKSFVCAFEGLYYNLRNEPNFLIQSGIALVAIVIALFLKITSTEWLFLLLVIAFVLAMEVMNTALEKVCDGLVAEKHPLVKIIKDSTAAAVLISSIASIAIGLIIFIPYLIELVQ